MTASLPTLSVVIPVYNEPVWIGRAVADLGEAIARSKLPLAELIIVDDGSDDETQAALRSLSSPFEPRVLRQPNGGRLAARRTGIEAASGDFVLLIDSRVSIRPDALEFVAQGLRPEQPLPVWNAHVDIDLDRNPYGRFWDVLTQWAFRAYTDNPRTTSYGLEDFDRFPKGMTCFLAPRDRLLKAINGYHSYYEDPREANDDTPIIRTLAADSPINISPGFSCLYRSRTSLPSFLRHAFHRGSVFVDGYGRPGTRFFPIIAAFYPASVIALLYGAHRPRLLPAGVALASAGGAGVALVRRRSGADVWALATLGPLWLSVFAAGMWRGLWLALQARRAVGVTGE